MFEFLCKGMVVAVRPPKETNGQLGYVTIDTGGLEESFQVPIALMKEASSGQLVRLAGRVRYRKFGAQAVPSFHVVTLTGCSDDKAELVKG